MIDINELRRKLGSDDLIDHIDIHANVKPIITELIGRIEAAEKDIALKERIIDSLGSELNAVANERDDLRAEVESWKGLAAQFGKEADKAKTHLAFAKDNLNHLRARIERMEKQEPVAWCATDETGTVVEALGMNQSRRFNTPLGFLPRAKGEEK